MWTSVLLVVLAFGQVPAKSVIKDNQKVIGADFIENVVEVSDGSRIVSGWEALPGQHPHHVQLRLRMVSGLLGGCGGSLVHQDWVVSAAHCTAQHVSATVRAGFVWGIAQYVDDTTTWYNHPSYNVALSHIVQPNDISLIRLSTPTRFSNLISPIRVQPSFDAFKNYGGEIFYASGHGRTWTGGATSEELRWVYLRALANEDCSRVFGSIITASSICARFYNVTSQSTCHGDSGGPLVHVGVDGVPTLVGIASFVAGEDHGGCHSGHPAGFIRPGPYHAWLTSVSGVDFENTYLPTTPELPETTVTTTPEPTWPTWPWPEESTTISTTTTTTRAPETEPWTRPPATTTWLPETTTTTTTSTTTPKPEPEPETEEDSSESEEDPELAQLLKKLEVKVKVKVNMSKYGHHKEIHHNSTVSHQHKH